MLAILIEKISSLCFGEKVQKAYFLSKHEEDKCDFSFSPPQLENPLQDIPYDQGVQLISEWFKTNPFSTVLNRTIMFDNYRRQKYDFLLYSAIFGSVLERKGITIKSQTKKTRIGSDFITYALSLLECETTAPSLIKMQALFVLSSHMVITNRSKTGISLMAMAAKMSLDLRIHEQDNDQFDQRLDPVDRELRTNIWWAMRCIWSRANFRCGSGINKYFALSTVKLPVKNENESSLYALDVKHGYIMNQLEHAQAIRDFYNCAFMTDIMTEIWIQIVPHHKLSLLNSRNPVNTEYDCSEPSHLQKTLATLPPRLTTMMASISSGLSPIHAAELLLCLNIIAIHSQFPKKEKDLLLFLEDRAVEECRNSANMIVDVAKIAVKDPRVFSIDPIVLFGLNTSISVYILLAESGSVEQREEAIFKLTEIQKLLECRHFGNITLELIRTIENFLSRGSGGHMLTTSPLHDNNRKIVAVAIPRALTTPLFDNDYLNSTVSQSSTLLVMVVKNEDQYSTEAVSNLLLTKYVGVLLDTRDDGEITEQCSALFRPVM
ncbi:uncharacterized protein VTP21DRAFT_8059 [Calcarisporiella thermophila]|uniref:uncharacterized protein n=1 Tax=Calcarisporiella thermophila TaxID=911321 RepID=UPI003742B7E2